eukprot:1825371-Karenia_brevis.AAC.1
MMPNWSQEKPQQTTLRPSGLMIEPRFCQKRAKMGRREQEQTKLDHDRAEILPKTSENGQT